MIHTDIHVDHAGMLSWLAQAHSNEHTYMDMHMTVPELMLVRRIAAIAAVVVVLVVRTGADEQVKPDYTTDCNKYVSNHSH